MRNTIILTLFVVGLKIYIKCGGGVQHHSLLNTQNLSEKTQKIVFTFQIGHKGIAKVTEFGDVWIGVLWLIYGRGVLNTPASNRVKANAFYNNLLCGKMKSSSDYFLTIY